MIIAIRSSHSLRMDNHDTINQVEYMQLRNDMRGNKHTRSCVENMILSAKKSSSTSDVKPSAYDKNIYANVKKPYANVKKPSANVKKPSTNVRHLSSYSKKSISTPVSKKFTRSKMLLRLGPNK